MKNCKLIATLPALNKMQKIIDIFKNDSISEVRFNTGTFVPYSTDETIYKLKELANTYHKKLWIDLKGRQLRITEWGNPMFDCIKLNHKISVQLPAKIYLRNDEYCEITHIIDGYKVLVNPLPKNVVGAGQSVNIIGNNLKIDGYLTKKDIEYIESCKKFKLKSFMLSFVEEFSDISDVLKLCPDAELVLKIESKKGMELVRKCPPGVRYMAARDDLYTQVGLDILQATKEMIEKDNSAICASRIFMSLQHGPNPELCDYEDLEMMYNMGYREYMLCDNICNYYLPYAVNAWNKWINF